MSRIRKSSATAAGKMVKQRAPAHVQPVPQPEVQKADNILPVPLAKDETPGQAIARALLRPTINAASTLKQIIRERDSVSLGDLIGELAAQCDAVNANQLDRAAGMLTAQAHTLDALFHRLARRAALNEGEYLDAADQYYRLALRAQSQCRATLESLALIKNPPPLAFVKQANIGQAVQVNNGTGVADANQAFSDQYARARTESEPNKLLEHSDGKRLDFGAPAATGSADSALETLGKVDRSAHVAR